MNNFKGYILILRDNTPIKEYFKICRDLKELSKSYYGTFQVNENRLVVPINTGDSLEDMKYMIYNRCRKTYIDSIEIKNRK